MKQDCKKSFVKCTMPGIDGKIMKYVHAKNLQREYESLTLGFTCRGEDFAEREDSVKKAGFRLDDCVGIDSAGTRYCRVQGLNEAEAIELGRVLYGVPRTIGYYAEYRGKLKYRSIAYDKWQEDGFGDKEATRKRCLPH